MAEDRDLEREEQDVEGHRLELEPDDPEETDEPEDED